jgi:hypothetical protein
LVCSYLELADWNMKEAIRSAKEDNEWEREMDSNSLKSGEIRITVDKDGLKAKGAGIVFSPRKGTTGSQEESQGKAESAKKKTHVKPISKAAIPSIASKTVKSEDVVNAASQHGNYGVELSTLPAKKE